MVTQAKNNWQKDILPLCPKEIAQLLYHVDSEAPLEEIRIRADQPIQLVFNGYDRLLYAFGHRPAATEEDCAMLLERICAHSIYAWEEELRSAFLTLPGGYRIGICGRATINEGRLDHISHITSINIRIARACLGAADMLIPYLADNMGMPYRTLLFSAPGCGKTTLLRDLVRQFSYGLHGTQPCRVLVVDERMELSGSMRGKSQHDLGPRTDVITGCKKETAFPLAIRTMSPQVMVTDELGGQGDADAVMDACFCGVTVIASVHAGNLEALLYRKELAGVIAQKAFDRLVLLGRSQGVGTIEGIWDSALHPVIMGRENRLCCAT